MKTLFVGPDLIQDPMTLVSNFSEYYPDSDSCSFSQLLAGAMASPVERPNLLAGNSTKYMNSGDGSDMKMVFKQNRPMNLVMAQSPLFMMPLGWSPFGLLNSPKFFSPLQAADLAQKNSVASRALAVKEDILEKELCEIQNVLLAMQEQQQKQLELILAIGKSGQLMDSR